MAGEWGTAGKMVAVEHWGGTPDSRWDGVQVMWWDTRQRWGTRQGWWIPDRDGGVPHMDGGVPDMSGGVPDR